jgi:Short C-terminal domain
MPLLMRRRPLLRAAAVGGGAYMMGKRHAENQEREAFQEQRVDQLEAQQATGPATGGMSSDAMQQLQQLGKLHEQGVLTDEEFAQQKQRLLA